MDYLFYSLFGGVWPLIIIATLIYLLVKVSRLSGRVRTLEAGSRYQPTVGTFDAARVVSTATYAGEPVLPNVAPAPTSTPASQPVAAETSEETSARWLGWVGAVMLLLGISFFLKYAFDNGWVGPTGQVAIGIIAGLSAVGIGQKLRGSYLKYSDMLFGAGIGILYLSIYAGFAFYSPVVIPQALAFVLMVMVTMLAMVIAIMGGTINIAVLGVLGGFLTPLLLSTGSNDLVTLSLYMLVLNLGVLGVSWYKKWVQLTFLAFLGTIVLFGGWMSRFYWSDPDAQLGMTFFFLTLFFVVFLVNSIIHHFGRQENSTKADLVLLALNAMGYFVVCYSILEPQYGPLLGFFALFLALLYLGVAYVTYASSKHDRILNLTLPGIAVVFLSIAVPLQLSGYFITIAWLVEALVLVYVGLMIKERPIQMFGAIVLLLGMSSMAREVTQIRGMSLYHTNTSSFIPIMNTAFLLLVLGVFVFYSLAYLYAKWQHPDGEWKKIVALFVILANVLTIFALSSEVGQKYDQDIARIQHEAQALMNTREQYGGPNAYFDYGSPAYKKQQMASVESAREISQLQSRSHTIVSVLWALYATLLIAIGFMRRIRVLRLFGLVFFFITACRVLIEAWSLGQLYRIISTIAFGVIALGAAYLYAKHKDKLKEIIYD